MRNETAGRALGGEKLAHPPSELLRLGRQPRRIEPEGLHVVPSAIAGGCTGRAGHDRLRPPL